MMIVYSTRELRAKIASHDYSAELCLHHAMVNIGALEMEMEALRKDAERLDWFADNVISVEDDEVRGLRWKVWCSNGLFAGETIRDAIDAAMAKEPR